MSQSQPPFQPVPPYGSPLAPRQKRSTLFKVLVIGGTLVGVAVLAVCAGLIYFGTNTPETRVLPGRQIPQKFVKQIAGLGILEDGEQIEFFYSDAIMNIEDGLYLVTDRAVIVYSTTYEEPTIRVPFEDIDEVETEYSDSWLVDSIVTLSVSDGSFVTFPLSPEGGGDRSVVEFLKKRTRAP